MPVIPPQQQGVPPGDKRLVQHNVRISPPDAQLGLPGRGCEMLDCRSRRCEGILINETEEPPGRRVRKPYGITILQDVVHDIFSFQQKPVNRLCGDDAMRAAHQLKPGLKRCDPGGLQHQVAFRVASHPDDGFRQGNGAGRRAVLNPKPWRAGRASKCSLGTVAVRAIICGR